MPQTGQKQGIRSLPRHGTDAKVQPEHLSPARFRPKLEGPLAGAQHLLQTVGEAVVQGVVRLCGPSGVPDVNAVIRRLRLK